MIAPFEFKLGAADDGTFEGYGSVFGVRDGHGDVVQSGAFRDSLNEWRRKGRLPAMMLQHGLGPLTQDQLPIGVYTHMAEDSHGLHVRGKLALGMQVANDVYTLMKMTPPALSGLSIGYRAKKFTVHRAGDVRRTLHAVHLHELSLVTDPSCDPARVTSVKTIVANNDNAVTALLKLRDAIRAA